MKIDSFFIANVLLLGALVAGASYLQNTYDTDKSHGEGAAATQNQNPAPTADTSLWHISTTSVTASTDTAPAVVKTASTPASKPASKPVVKPSVRRLYNEDDD